MGKTGTTGLKRVINAAGYSVKGLRAAFVHEAAFRQEVCLAVVLWIAAFMLNVSTVERAIMLTTVMLVLIVELCNSAIEAIVDRVGSEYHELSGRAKDIGSAAVLLSLLLVVICWGLILFPLIFS